MITIHISYHDLDVFTWGFTIGAMLVNIIWLVLTLKRLP